MTGAPAAQAGVGAPAALLTAAAAPSIKRQRAETSALRYVFDASRELAEHIAESVEPPTPISEPTASLVTHYGESFNGSILGCGTGYYSSDNPTIVAVGPARDGEMPCGTLLHICGSGGCITAQRQDACPGCSPILFDLSESAFAAVCGQPSGVCEATVSVMLACESLDLAWEDRPVPPAPPGRQRTVLDDLAEGALLVLLPERPGTAATTPEAAGEDTGPSPDSSGCALR